MSRSVYDLKSFYATPQGRLVRRLILARIREMWPQIKGMRLMGMGYAVPYLRGLMEGTERTFTLMPPSGGVHFWPEREKGLVALSAESEWPVETESVDRILLVHSLEHAQMPQALLQEAWRVLKSNGRLMLVVPNRLGFWARADWTPFGQGTPYTAAQINHYLAESLFVHERTEKALFLPPFRSFPLLRGAYTLENLGRRLFPGLAGLYLVEASKQIYAGAGRVRADRIPGRRIIVGAPVGAGRFSLL
jgi:SAM-dependent methyltransferase